jgi:hypothetical protein
MRELLQAERRVAEAHALIEQQRKYIEKLVYEGRDIISAQIIFDSLLVSLSLHVQDRNRWRCRLTLSASPRVA